MKLFLKTERSQTLSIKQRKKMERLKREVSSLNVHCSNQGCTWKGLIGELENHTAACDFNQVSCPHSKCGKIVRKSELVTHLTSDCNYRLVKCNFCKADISFNAVEVHHANVCPIVPCTMCRNWVQRSKVSQHQDPLRGDCEAIVGPCPFVEAGCPNIKPMSAKNRKKHMKEAVVSHLTQLLAIVMKLSEDVQNLTTGEGRAASGAVAFAMRTDPSAAVASAVVRETSGAVASTMGRDASEAVASIMGGTASFATTFFSNSEGTEMEDNSSNRPSSNLEPSNNCVEESNVPGIRDLPVRMPEEYIRRPLLLPLNMENNNTARSEKARSFVTKIPIQRPLGASQETNGTQNNMVVLRNVALADSEEYIRQQEVSSYDGILLWKISNFARRKSDAQGGRQTSFHSPSFYTSCHGYKMCARIYLNGDGMGKGTHISLFFVVMRGQHDTLLSWPFRQKVNLMILDHDNVKHVIDVFRPDPNSSSFQRPRKEMNIASGCPLFFPLSDLDKHAYVRDDTLFVKIIVDTSNL